MTEMQKVIHGMTAVAYNHYTVKRKGRVIVGETKRIRNAAKRARRALRS